MSRKPLLCLDFDGVIHSYEDGWRDGSIYGSITPGFWRWAIEAERHFKLAIYSSRSSCEGQRQAMKAWLEAEWARSAERAQGHEMPLFELLHEKPPAFLTIDDRALTFTGRWSDFEPSTLLAFQPWNRR